MMRTLTATFLIILSVSHPALSQHGQIDPAGIAGSLVISGNKLPDDALDEFLQLAGGDAACITLIRTDSDESTRARAMKLIQFWDEHDAASIQLMRIAAADQVQQDELQSSFNTLTGIWLEGSNPDRMRDMLLETPLGETVQQLVKRGGVLGSSQSASLLIAASRMTPGAEHAEDKGLGLLPASLLGFLSQDEDNTADLSTALRSDRPEVGYELDEDAALVLRGRRLQAVGGGIVRIHLAASEHRPARQIELNRRQRFADLTALRRSAIDRTLAQFPAESPQPPDVENGTLLIVGGGVLHELAAKFVALAGGEQARIVVLPTAAPDPLPRRSGIANTFRRLGAKSVTVLPGRRRSDVESQESLDAYKNATGVWFSGGRQWRFVDAYLDTQVVQLMHDILKRGGVIGGSSAGASIQAEYLARGNPLGNLDIMSEGYERGLGFLKGVAIDQHFRQRDRFRDMSSLVDRFPQLLGIGIDEETAIVVQGPVAEVLGKGAVHFFDKNRLPKEGKDYETVEANGRYDLRQRLVLDSGGAAADKPSDELDAAAPEAAGTP